MTSEAVRIGVIGAGWWAVTNHIPALLANPAVELVGICGLEPEQLRRVQDRFNIPFATQSYAELLAHGELHGVVVSSPHTLHYEHARAGLKRGCHVLVEKPLATTARDARDLVRLERETARTIVVPFGWNFSPLAKNAMELLQDRPIGELRHVALHMATPVFRLLSGLPSEATRSDFLQPDASTWADPRNAGGFGWGQLSHALGLLFLLTDASAEVVFAMTGRTEKGADLFDAAVIRFASGATASVSGSGGLAAQAKSQLELRLFGAAGHLTVDFDIERVELQMCNGETRRAALEPGCGEYRCIEPTNFFVEVCKGTQLRNPASALIGCKSTEVLEALYRSAQNGAAVRIASL